VVRRPIVPQAISRRRTGSGLGTPCPARRPPQPAAGLPAGRSARGAAAWHTTAAGGAHRLTRSHWLVPGMVHQPAWIATGIARAGLRHVALGRPRMTLTVAITALDHSGLEAVVIIRRTDLAALATLLAPARIVAVRGCADGCCRGFGAVGRGRIGISGLGSGGRPRRGPRRSRLLDTSARSGHGARGWWRCAAAPTAIAPLRAIGLTAPAGDRGEDEGCTKRPNRDHSLHSDVDSQYPPIQADHPEGRVGPGPDHNASWRHPDARA
jgi:hypothetical protein